MDEYFIYEEPGTNPVFTVHCNSIQFMQSLVAEKLPSGESVVHIGYGDQDIDALIATVPLEKVLQFIESADKKM